MTYSDFRGELRGIQWIADSPDIPLVSARSEIALVSECPGDRGALTGA